MKIGTARGAVVSLIPIGLALGALGAIACSDTTPTPATSTASAATPGAPRARIMPVRRISNDATGANAASANSGVAAATSSTALKYWGGPVIQHVKVFIVYWGSGVSYASSLPSFYGDVTNSQYMDWLVEYATPTQTIGRGAYIGSYTDVSAARGTVSNAAIAAELSRLIDAGTIPANDADTLYMVHFPPGVNITLDSAQSCVEFCAFHNTAEHGGQNLIYGVMPDLGGSCSSGCGGGTPLQNLTSVSSHELIEAVTDPAIGLVADAIGAPAGWYDQANGEIGDICNAEQATIGSWVVQKQWSNKKNACVLIGPMLPSADAGTPTPVPDAGTPTPSTCSHALCTQGTKLERACDACATSICNADSYCCNTKWDDQCVSEVASICGQSCP